VFEMDRPRPPVEIEPLPVPELEGENVGRRADLEDDVVLAGTMDCAGWNRKVIVLAGRPLIDMPLDREVRAALVSSTKVTLERMCIGVVLEAQVDDRSGLAVEHVVALVLGVSETEVLCHVGAKRMHLEGEISALHRVEEVESDRKLSPEGAEHVVAEERFRLLVDERQGRRLEPARSEPETQAVLLRHAVEAPGEVRGLLR
jgi:hypothetical protein